MLDLTGNNLVGYIQKEVAGLSSLSISLHLVHNLLSGSFPIEEGRLTNLKELDLSHNELSGETPSILHTCVKLEHLGISNNLFGGRIPQSFQMQRQFQFQGIINYVEVGPSLICQHVGALILQSLLSNPL